MLHIICTLLHCSSLPIPPPPLLLLLLNSLNKPWQGRSCTRKGRASSVQASMISDRSPAWQNVHIIHQSRPYMLLHHGHIGTGEVLPKTAACPIMGEGGRTTLEYSYGDLPVNLFHPKISTDLSACKFIAM